MIASNFYRFGYNIKACEKLSEQLKRKALIQNGLFENVLNGVPISFRQYNTD